jgi:hypothetical protein
MQVAVFIRSDRFIAPGKSEYSNRLIAGFQGLALAAFLCLKDDPLNIMRLQHRMFHRTNSDGDGLSVDLHYGNVLFTCGVGGVWDEGLHFFSAATAPDAGILDMCDDVAAVFASVERHVNILL